MRNSKKKVFVTALAVCLIAILSFGTLAWFSDSDEVTNQFHIATSDDATDPDDIFSVDVWEYVDGDTENKVGEGSEEDLEEGTPNGNTYENILPGGRYHKEPYVENTGAYEQWVRVKVTLSDAGAWMDIMNKYSLTDLSKIFEGHDESAWTLGETSYENDYLTYTYYLNYKLAPGETACLFHTVVLPTELTQEDMATLGGDFGLDIMAEAVQTENLGDGVDTAQEAFAVVMPTP